MVAPSQQALSELRWEDFRILLALARTPRLRDAARTLAVNASTVSRRLDALEAALGLRLFDRTASGLTPTAAPEEVLPEAESVEAAVESFLRRIAGMEQTREGTVRITARSVDRSRGAFPCPSETHPARLIDSSRAREPS
ncbi:MAG: LysR family transcriptional regulator [Myxococcota bacterium]